MSCDTGDGPAALSRARRIGLVRPYDEDHFVVRSPVQGAASTLADRLGAALAEHADTVGDGRLRAALDEIRVGAIADSAGTIHRQ